MDFDSRFGVSRGNRFGMLMGWPYFFSFTLIQFPDIKYSFSKNNLLWSKT